jgi:fatty aldehyde-generating acyl-ACP reductase
LKRQFLVVYCLSLTLNQMKFAVIGHQEEWDKITRFTGLQQAMSSPQELEAFRQHYALIPPSPLFDIEVYSPMGTVKGFYIETFIAPDELDAAHLWQNLRKVKIACEKAAALGADIVSLGGFTSIVLEIGNQSFSYVNQTAFTTGNTLTAAFIADSLEKAAAYWNQSLSESRLLVIGATGDIGSACVRYFAGSVRELLLNARQTGPLRELEKTLIKQGISCKGDVLAENLLPEADLVICVASSQLPENYLNLLPPHAIVCDAGYPKNLQSSYEQPFIKVYAGGMGKVASGFHFSPAVYQDMIYDFGLPGISHGCILESIVLALEGMAVPYSTGKGNIQKQQMEQILEMAARHGIVTAPFFNASGLLEIPIACSVKAKW